MSYVPNRGDLVWLSFDPGAGHEQRGRRPAIVLSRRDYNERTGLMLACPVTSRAKGYPFEIPISSENISGVALADHVRSVDWRARNAEFIASAEEIADRATALVTALIARAA